ncbi:glycosyltransferase family 4 protein [Chitinophaga pollutisoli]|uniref:Glycosyltransferase family 4 protein n=1 Tax=Chitinophaga pollutisoli TaxID=3133966 RepID=A0ABZ2YVM0_9BACT
MSPLRIYLISNLYPKEEANDYYGVFVKNFITSLGQSNEIAFTGFSLIRGRGKSRMEKLVKYIRFYADILRKGLFGKYDIIYVHNVSHTALPLLAVRLFTRKDIVLNPHGEDILTNSKTTALLLKLAKPLIRKANIVAPSGFFRDIIIRQFRKKKEDVAIYPSGGVDTRFFTPAEDRVAREDYCIGFVSRLDAKKGWETYLKTMKALAMNGFPVRGLVAGKGTQVAEFEHMLQELGLEKHVLYAGGLNQQALADLYRQMDIFVFPTEYEESLGLVGLEAMACGVPVAGTRIGGLQDFIKDHENGYFFEKGDHAVLTNILIQFIQLSPAEKQRLSVNARATALQFDATKARTELIQQLKHWFNTRKI